MFATYDSWKTTDTRELDEACASCGGTGTDGGHRCTSYDCCGPCRDCDGTGCAQEPEPEVDPPCDPKRLQLIPIIREVQ